MRWLVNWFSNFEKMDKPMAHNGLLYETVEHFYAAMKTEDLDVRAKIAAMSYPGQAKKYAAKIPLVEDWDSIKESVMWTALQWKFRRGSMWGDILASTYDVELVEWNNWHDNFWGWCVCHRCANNYDIMPKNKLGKMLMQIREGLM